MKPREFTLSTGTKIFLGKDAENNDELVREFKGRKNTILHTDSPGSPFCVIEELNPSKEEIYLSGAHCVLKSQDWRDNKRDTPINVFTGNDVKRTIFMKTGSWKLKKNPKRIVIKSKDVKALERELKK